MKIFMIKASHLLNNTVVFDTHMFMVKKHIMKLIKKFKYF